LFTSHLKQRAAVHSSNQSQVMTLKQTKWMVRTCIVGSWFIIRYDVCPLSCVNA